MPAPKGNRYAANGIKHTRGRKTTYQPQYAKQVYKLILLHGPDTTEENIANHFEVSVGCIRKWKRVHQDFRDAIGSAKQQDGRVADSMYRRAIGYSHRSEEILFDPKSLCNKCSGSGTNQDDGEQCKKCVGSGKLIIRVPTRKKYAPDTKAGLSILARIDRSWQPKRAIEFTGTDDGPIKVDLSQIDTNQLGQETLDKIAELIQKDLADKKEKKLGSKKEKKQ